MIGKILGGRYELLEKIGGGGMATVYKAKCHLLKRYVAIKVLRPEFVEDEDFVYRFKRESQAAASLSHQNIVNIYDVGQEEDIHYIVMEYVKGETLKDLIRRNKRLQSEKATEIAIQICNALEHAHKNHVIHRDIKPQNILVGENGIVKVADFGIARAVTSSTVTLAGTNVVGSVHYFSPEQARGGFTDEKSDLYSLGIVIYEMVTGTVPFEGESPISVAIKHIQETVKPPRDINPDVPISLQDIILKAIEKEQNNRYLNAREMEDDLRKSLREPNGNFVTKVMDSDAPTQVIPPVKDENIDVTKMAPRSSKKGKNSNYLILRLVIGVIVLLGLFVSLFLIGRSIYNNNFKVVEVPTPKVLGVSEIQAKNLLEDAGLIMDPTRKSDAKVPEGVIISQDPMPDEYIKKGDTVKVVISNGPSRVQIPDVVKRSYTDAANQIEALGLKVGQVDRVVTDSLPQNFIVDQSPKPGQEVLPGTEVNLTVSKVPEPAMVQAPNLIGLKLEDAKVIIGKWNLRIGKTNYEYSDQPEGKILKQNPEPDSDIEENGKVDLWVSKGTKQSYAKKVTIPLGDIEDNTKVRIVLVDQAGNEKEIHNEIHNKGESEIMLFIEGEQGTQTLVVYINGVKELERQINFDAKEDVQ